MRNIIVGTAGHIDHGKTALVRALTGTDTDRLEEEKRRGISIDLGFAHLELAPDIRLGFVDVPGHERFVRNMLAGAGGMDLVMLVVAADESIKPQTREHFDICRLLGIRRGLIALTKADLVGGELLELVRMEVEEFVAGSFLEGAPIVPVSAVTGAGLDNLRSELARIAAAVAVKDATQPLRLPVDRSFSMRGFGTVITGTLISGTVSVDDEVEIHPGRLLVRVRGVQVHGENAPRASAGQRTALNLAGVEASQLRRGMTVTQPGLFQPTQTVDAAFDLLPSAKPLKHRAPVHFHAWTSETEAEARLLEGASALEPGSGGMLRFRLREPVLLLPGDRFIVRMFSPVVTIGGGVVLDIAPPVRSKGAAAVDRLRVLASGDDRQVAALLVRENLHGLSFSELTARTGWPPERVERAATGAGMVLIREPEARALDAGWARDAIARLRDAVAAFHERNPLLPGMPKEALRAAELPGSPPYLLDCLLSLTREIAVEGDTLRLAAHRLQLRQDEQGALDRIEAAFARAGLAAPSAEEVLARCGVEPARARNLLQILLRQRKLIRAGEGLVFHHSAIDGVKKLLAARKGQRFAVPRFKEWTGVSRKYAIPLLELLDRERVTRREGDERVIL